jgi:hypothetical protein
MRDMKRREKQTQEQEPDLWFELEARAASAFSAPKHERTLGKEEGAVETVPDIVVQDPEGEDEVDELLKEWTTVLG